MGEFIRLLKAHRVQRVIDVLTIPRSQHKELVEDVVGFCYGRVGRSVCHRSLGDSLRSNRRHRSRKAAGHQVREARLAGDIQCNGRHRYHPRADSGGAERAKCREVGLVPRLNDQHQLPDVHARLHDAMRLGCVAQRKRRVNDRLDRAGLEERPYVLVDRRGDDAFVCDRPRP
jgi:hypothetical protein